MGWFDGWFGSDNSSSDPLRRLDPKLREFLERESPVKYNSSSSQQPPQQQQQTQSTSSQDSQQQQQQNQPPPVPPQSLYQDGRYAHLWKTYRPLSVVEAETKTDSEKLADVLEAFKERKAKIGRAALENCADEQFSWAECMRGGSWSARATLCRAEVQRFERCYAAQSRLLKALGYLGVAGRTPEADEEIQMRADELYHRMLAQEREIERAREEGREPPVFPPLLDGAGKDAAGAAAGAGAGAGPTPAADKAPDGLEPGPATLAAWKQQLEKLPPEDREAEEQALRAEYRAKAEMAAKIQGIWQEQAKEREARRAEGKETIFDKFAGLFSSLSGPKST
ncbi:uncharacterized protein THITE_2121980 [Thermothielavioides terrestris NRRL 8126]|uniref:Autophagy protein n=1 Tax=Thermothielavioides terrestris (strain ATCC 38088 / NRRL 8126) TaxID=578455 RepID=G2RFJ4_THETT|nr:uncharacterized protein THITE_2121980 [Thermothielavioides terrestris NRRL 8126]AEO70477.1 hypothetical protein THITE_2121980 [Thermothielavioides terrestris NRRL 8126]